MMLRKIYRSKLIIICLSLIFIFCFTSCIPIVKLSKRGLVKSLGVDYKNNMFIVSVQILNASSSSQNQSKGSKPSNSNDIMVVSKGVTIIDAIKKMSLKQNLKIYHKVTNIIILGKDIAQNKKLFKWTMDSLHKIYMAAPNIYISMTDKTAYEIIKTAMDQKNNPSSFIQDMLQSSEKQAYVQKVFFSDVVASLNSIDKSISMPLITKDVLKDKTERLHVKGIGLFNNGKFKGTILADDVKYLMLLNDKKHHIDINFSSKKFGTCNFNIIKKSSTIKPVIKNDKIYFYINLRVITTLLENSEGWDIRNLSESNIRKMEGMQKYYLEKNIPKLLDKLLRKYKTDIVYFTNDIYRSHYDFWLKHKDNWDNTLAQARVVVKVTPHIFRSIIEHPKLFKAKAHYNILL